MKLLFSIAVLLINQTFIIAQKTDTSKVVFEGNSIYEISDPTNNKLIIFLHGGVQNPHFNQPSENIALEFLIENNDDFLKQAAQNKFDIIAPITNNELEWVNNPEGAFTLLKDFIESRTKEYKEIYISGFSDGGTGGYKIFYNHSDFFSGLVVFNGYPQHSNFYKTVDHFSVINKKVVFFGTLNDEMIPYEFMMTEYCIQKEVNANTFLYLTNGSHSFLSYNQEDLGELFSILTSANTNKRKKAIQGFIKNDKVVIVYPYRKKIVKEFRFGEEVYKENLIQLKKYKK